MIAGAGVEQDADHGEVEAGAQAFGAVAVQRRRQTGPAVLAGNDEMPPAAVIGNVEVGIGQPDLVDDAVDRVRKGDGRDREAAQPVGFACREDLAAAVADGMRPAQQRQCLCGLGVHGHALTLNSRPGRGP